MSIVPAIKDFWSALRGQRSAWDRLRREQIDEQVFAARSTFNQWSAKVQAFNREEVDCEKRGAGTTGPQRMLFGRQALAARRQARMAMRVAETMLGVIEALEQLKINRDAYEAMKKAGSADLARIVGQLESSRELLGQKLIEVESIPPAAELPTTGITASDAELAEVMREIERIETLRAEGKSEPEIDAALRTEPERA